MQCVRCARPPENWSAWGPKSSPNGTLDFAAKLCQPTATWAPSEWTVNLASPAGFSCALSILLLSRDASLLKLTLHLGQICVRVTMRELLLSTEAQTQRVRNTPTSLGTACCTATFIRGQPTQGEGRGGKEMRVAQYFVRPQMTMGNCAHVGNIIFVVVFQPMVFPCLADLLINPQIHFTDLTVSW